MAAHSLPGHRACVRVLVLMTAGPYAQNVSRQLKDAQHAGSTQLQDTTHDRGLAQCVLPGI